MVLVRAAGNSGVNVNNQYGNIIVAQDAANYIGAQYPGINIVVSDTTYNGNIYGGFAVQDDTYVSYVQIAANSYTPEYGPETVGWIGSNAQNPNGSNTAIIFRTGSAEMEVFKPIVANYPITLIPQGAPTSPAAGTLVYIQTGGYTIWQHEFGQNAVGLNTESAIYSSITTSDISWLTGNPSQDGLVGVNRRMHLRRIEPNFLQTGTMAMTILGRKFPNGPVEEDSGPYYFDPDTEKIDLRIEHRLIRLKFESNTLNGNYEMGRLMVTAEYGDERP